MLKPRPAAGPARAARHLGSAMLLTLVLLAAGRCAPALENVRAFTTADSVRIDLVPSAGEDLAAAHLSASITQAATGKRLWQGPLRPGGSTTVSGLKPELWSPDSPVLYDLEVTVRSRRRESALDSAAKECADCPAVAGLRNGEAVSEECADGRRRLRNKEAVSARRVRIGFRSFEIREGQFRLNGRPVFLRGIAINPPGRTIPAAVGESRAFAEAYVRYLKSQNVNIFRLTTDESQVWFDVCDELGMMMYAGRYGAPPGADEGKHVAPGDYDRCIAGYRKLFESYASHPCIVMYLLANELPVSGRRGQAFSELLTRAHAALKQWDATRPYIGNAGYGEGREGDVCDVHRYWGWYYNSFLTYYNLRDRLYPQPLFGDPAKNQPLTFTECVGSFTGWKGEFNLVRSKQLAPQLGWIGHTAERRQDALDYQSFLVKQATESFRRLRPLNPRLAGLMPFTILFYNWSGISAFDQMQPKPAMEQLGCSYQPVLLSWELWTPQVYAGTALRAIPHVINDAEDGRALTNAELRYRLQGSDGAESCAGKIDLPSVPYFGTWSQPVVLDLPKGLATGEYLLSGRVLCGSRLISTNAVKVFIAGADWRKPPPPTERTVYLYDPAGRTAAALEKLGVRNTRIPALWSGEGGIVGAQFRSERMRRLSRRRGTTEDLPAQMKTLIIGEGALDRVTADQAEKLRRYVREGGRVLCLGPVTNGFGEGWLPAEITALQGSPNDPAYPPRTRPFREQMNVNPERPEHPVFRGLDRHRLQLWSDYTGWDETKPGFPRVYPVTAGFKLKQAEALAQTAILADYDRGLEGVALCEMFDGKGSILVSGFDLVNRCGRDPVADRLLANLISYAAADHDHSAHPRIDSPILWGDYATERGVVCGSLNGLVVNAEWEAPPTNPSAQPLACNTGSWNMDPGSQFIPRGRNPFGPYGYSTAASLKDLNPDSDTGTGIFWARLPPGRTAVLTRVKNPAAKPARLTIAVNGAPALASATIPPGQTVELRAPLSPGAREVSVRYTGTKTLVLRETRFE